MSPAVVHLAILRSAAILVPAAQRTDWLAEWRSELWHAGKNSSETNLTAFCMGAFRDAFWLWRDDPRPDRYSLSAESPTRCLAWLAALGAVCMAVALLLPAARPVLLGTLYPRNLVMLTAGPRSDPFAANSFYDPGPSVKWSQFQSLKVRDQDQFTGLAFYLPKHIEVATPHGKRSLLVARTTPDLFRLLNLPAAHGLVLSSAARAKYFDNDPRMRSVSASQWNLPLNVDGWLIEDESTLATLPGDAQGFLLGRLRYEVLHDSSFRYIRLADRSLQMLLIALPMFLAAAALLIVMKLGSSGTPLWRNGPRRGLFLAAKILLVLPIIAFGSLDLASLATTVSPLFFDAAFFGSMLAVRWIIADQRQRCPVCLRLLTHPVRIGESSRILLEWHGTELMCDRGHGLLYVPEWPAIWSARQRWMNLGPSWGNLFH